ncbi:unnamed protein product [Notodromas monacha]|uniref:OCIA domain-containing protein n=1 Tax=Notodromas monacha TaxID=399045 RepID=A0A7R9BSX4_9CRUS|nr:unnamed protein product [Notodromas monacha]CAG0921143.1 unnamed protein product [Notodromas monacha]
MAGVPPKEPDHDCELRERLELSQDKLQVLQRCNMESFWYRSFPFAIGLLVLAHLGIQKVLLATLVGYIAGKFSYWDKCAEMIMELPNSHLAETLRRNQQNAGRPPIPNEELSVPVYSKPTFKQIASRTARDGSVCDLDNYRKPDLDLLLATLVGYIAGKFSYWDKCAEMIMELPNSHLAETLRRNQQNAGRPPIPNEELSVPVYSKPTSKQIASRRARDGSVCDLDNYCKPDLDLSSFQE